MRDVDVRDLEGRAGRLVASITIGLSAAVVIATSLPYFRGFGGGPSSFAVPVLIAAGAVVLAILVHAVLYVATHRPPRVHVPKARAVSSRAARRRR